MRVFSCSVTLSAAHTLRPGHASVSWRAVGRWVPALLHARLPLFLSDTQTSLICSVLPHTTIPTSAWTCCHYGGLWVTSSQDKFMLSESGTLCTGLASFSLVNINTDGELRKRCSLVSSLLRGQLQRLV